MFGIFLIQAFEIIYKLVLIYNRVSEKVWFGVKTLSETSLEKTTFKGEFSDFVQQNCLLFTTD